MSVPPPCFALLDDCTRSAAAPGARLYTDWHSTLRCEQVAQLPALLAQMEQALATGLHALALFDYELGNALHGLPETGGAAQILLFRRCVRLSAAEVNDWLAAHGEDGPAGVGGLQANVNQAGFSQALARIHAYIESGDTYQVNYTMRLRFAAFGAPLALYARLRARQPVPYGALIALPDGRTILSLSPELFVRHAEGALTARPMKGTAAAADDEAENARRGAALAADPKNRAENLMIVDLLRNDLGRVAEPGSVKVPALFEVTRFGRVLQMTSTVQARLHSGTTLAQIFGALYPCGSITGAPKRRTMEIVRELEPEPRGLYTGAIGWFDAGHNGAPGPFCLSVPIRTLVLQAPQNGVRAGEMGVGAGIVFDSDAADEYAECLLKARFLTGLAQDFELFETLYATRAEGCRHQARHLARLQASAAWFGFACDGAALATALEQACTVLPDGPQRLRLALRQDGECAVRSAPLAALAVPVTLMLAPQPTAGASLFLRHKTSVRAQYDLAWRAAEQDGAFDMLFFNGAGELTEGGRTNIFVKLDGHWYTPPLRCGLLPGVMRAVLLEDATLAARERVLRREDLRRAEQLMVCNALRGALPATLRWPD